MREDNQHYYREIPLLPLRGVLVFPYMVIHLDVGREKSINAIEEAMLEDKKIFLATQIEAQTDDPEEDDIYQVGTLAEIKQILKMPGGTMRVLVEGLHRAEIQEYVSYDPYYKVGIREFRDLPAQKVPEVEALMRTLVYQFEQYVKLSKKIPPETVVSVVAIEEPGCLADVIASHLSLRIKEKQSILEAFDIKKRLEIICQILAKEMESLNWREKLTSGSGNRWKNPERVLFAGADEGHTKELGDKDDRVAEGQELRERSLRPVFLKKWRKSSQRGRAVGENATHGGRSRSSTQLS